MCKKQEILEKYFPGYEFRDIQAQAIDKVIASQSTMCLMPTGGGKSLIFQVAGLTLNKITIVISPLIALMDQQVDRLVKEQGIDAICLSGKGNQDLYNLLRDIDFSEGGKFIFMSPEKAAFDGYIEYLLKQNRDYVGLIVLDEAHCVSQWGHSFRPAYKVVPQFLDRAFGSFGWPKVIALTATLNPRDREEICRDFRIDPKDIIESPSLLRDNLQLTVETLADEAAKKIRLKEILQNYRLNQEGNPNKIIVYTHRKSGKYGTRAFAQEYQEEGWNCDYFDADLPDNRKDEVLKSFETGQTDIIFSTNAFGMGIDIPDIRVVIHYLIPESIEQYYQEVGRAGRDGYPAFGHLLYSEKNISVRQDMLKSSFPKLEEIQNACLSSPLAIQGGKPISSLSPLLDFPEKSSLMMIFYELIERGFIKVLVKGIRRIACFTPYQNSDFSEFTQFEQASKPGLMLQIVHKMGQSLTSVTDKLYEAFTQRQTRLTSAPEKVVFYEYPNKPSEKEIEEIAKSFDEKRQAKLEAFQQLVALVEANSDPTAAICKHLGIQMESRDS
ncbi:ATP-dependent DNA helicase RecQ [Nodosilinea sp. FACHB-131]|uniref:RecQ family ATP-dependent DNA helicase n=1 Tax=Cyanophyceae TaxID=3028117 RepID=UPI001689C8C5|nr:RecQ family ATP-dependent DNA helicase [Nodosilinea sp. FACHB-131]MBD1871884.1 ATP-dependent DNA helicase RecQ [Nodosilinea sp. FACHB-131]